MPNHCYKITQFSAITQILNIKSEKKKRRFTDDVRCLLFSRGKNQESLFYRQLIGDIDTVNRDGDEFIAVGVGCRNLATLI